jgi:DNA modification methylase
MKPKVTEDGKMEINIGEVHIVLDQVVTGQVCIKKEKTDIWREKKPTKSDLHPTMKPIKLVQKALKASSKRNDIVLDLFGGSGSTIIACEKSERIGYSMELDPQYVDVIINRWELLTGQKAKKL